MIGLSGVRDRVRPTHATLIASGVYGSLASAAIISVLDDDATATTGDYVAETLATVLVLWVAHLYAHWLGSSLAHDEVGYRHFRREIMASSPLPLAAIPPLVPITVAATGLWSLDTATYVSLTITVLILGGSGLMVARRRRVRLIGVVGLVARSSLLGVLIVVLEWAVH